MNSGVADYDVLIVGGGLVGASLACMLEAAPIKVAIIEAHELHAASQPSYDDRTVALSFGSRNILNAMGLWAAIEKNIEPIKTIHISDQGHFGVSRLKHTEEAVDALGYVAENRVLGEALYKQLSRNKNLTLLCPGEIISLEQNDDQVQVGFSYEGKEHQCTSKLVIAADGVNSKVRKLLQIDSNVQMYEQTAIVANITPGVAHKNIAYERFTETGPFALLPMTENRCSLVWSLPSDKAGQMMQLSDEKFLDACQQAFGFRLGQFKKVGKRSSYPLALVEATEVVSGRVLIAGNAAHTIHPVAGQGFNLALRDIALLSELLYEAEDYGDVKLLERYATLREQDTQKVFRFTDALIKIFSNRFLPLAHLRSAGLLLVDLLPPVKHALAKQSMGLSGRLSKLNRGLSL